MVRLDFPRPTLLHRFVESLKQHIWVLPIRSGHVIEKRLCFFLVLVRFVVMPIYNYIDAQSYTRCDNCMQFGCLSLWVLQMAAHFDTHCCTQQCYFPIFAHPLQHPRSSNAPSTATKRMTFLSASLACLF